MPDAITGTKLLEGDPPKRYVLSQNGLEKYAVYWHKIRAVICDSTGKKYYSETVKEKPSWVDQKTG